jgi:hypothetical protein
MKICVLAQSVKRESARVSRLAGASALLCLGVACGTSDEKPALVSSGGQSSGNIGGGSNWAGSSSGAPTTTLAGSSNQGGSAGSLAGGSGAGGASGAGGSGGTAAGSGGAASGGSGGAPAAGGSAACVTAGTELCDDFETGQLDLQKWSIKKPTASAGLAVDDTKPHRGKYSLHIQLQAGQSSTAQIADAVSFPAASNTFYTRAYFYLSPDLPGDDNGGFHMAYLLATGNNDLGFVEAGLGSSGNKQYLGYSEYYGAGPGVHSHGPTFTEFGPRSQLQVMPMKWLCLELMQGGDATTTSRRIWVDGSELTDQKSNYTERKPPTFDLISIGVLQYHTTPLLTDVWIDDIRVSKQPIGCDP